MNNIMQEFKQKTTQNGLRVFLITLLVLIGLVVANLLFSKLPISVTELDISADKMYSVSNTTKRSVSKLSEDVELYYLAAGGEDALADAPRHTHIFLQKLSDHSSHLSVTLVDTALEPTFAASLGIAETPETGSIIVKSDKRTRIITQNDLFYYYIEGLGKMTEAEAQQAVYMIQMYYGQSVTPTYHFDGEGQLLSAIDFVLADDLPLAYALDGHSELALSQTLLEELSRQNIQTDTLSLLKTGAIPKDCALLIINCPKTDLTAEESALISAYLDGGGKLMLITEPTVSSLPNLLLIAEKYGLSAEDGIVVETDANLYKQYPFYLFPSVASHEVTAEYASSAYIMLPGAHGIQIAGTLPDGVSASPLLQTSEGAYIIPTDAESMELPEGQTPKTHHVGVAAEATNGSKLVWVSSYGLTDDSANSYAASGNYIYFLSAAKWLAEATESISPVGPLTLSTSYLTVPTASAGLWSIVLIFLIPLSVFALGLVYWLRRRKK